MPDVDGAVPGSSGTGNTSGSSSSISDTSTPKINKQRKRNSAAAALGDIKSLLQESLRKNIEEDNFMLQLLDRQERMLREFTTSMLKGIGKLFKKDLSDSESE